MCFPAGNLAETLRAMHGDFVGNPAVRKQVNEAIKSLQVEATHYVNQGKPYKRLFVVDSLINNSADQEIIPNLKKTVAQYFKDNYSISLKYPNLPCVMLRGGKGCMPMEVLNVLPFQEVRKQTASTISCTAVRPMERFKMLRNFVQKMNWRNNLLSKMQLRLLNFEPIKVEARELPQPSASFSNKTGLLTRGKWRQESFYKLCSEVVKCVVVTIAPGVVSSFLFRLLQRVG